MDKAYLEISNFSPGIYRIDIDLRSLSKEDLENHYLRYGISEGRFYNTITDRKSFLDFVNKKGKMLEIGPLDNPQLDPGSPNYYSVDVFDRATLIKNYRDHSHINKDKIIEPTFVITNNDYSGIKEKFNCIFSSHNIEHMPCVVTYLNNLTNLLTDEGCINLIIPDKRYCFDYFKPETTIYDVIQLYHEKPRRPRLSDVLRMRIQSTHNDSNEHWHTKNHGVDRTESELPSQYESIVKEYNEGNYIDAHVSYFTPGSFMSIINSLRDIGMIDLKIHKMFHTLKGAIEFYVILKKNR